MDVLHYYATLVAIVCFLQVSLAQNRNQECYQLNIVGNIKSENYPQDYGNNQPDCWILRAEPGMNVRLTINDLDVEECGSRSCGCDGIKIYNGDVSSLQNQQGCPLCGSSVSSEPITSTGDSMRVEFYSDGSVTGAGFSAAFTSVYGPIDELPCYRYPQVPLPDGLCGAEKLTGIIKNILHIVQDTMPITFQMAAAELRAEGVDIVSDEGIQQLACYMNDVASVGDITTLLFSNPNIGHAYQMMAPLLKNIEGDHLRQGLLSIRKLIHWIRRTGAPTLPLIDTTYAETWAFFTELQAEVPETFQADASPFASFIMGMRPDELFGPLPLGEFFTGSPEELARVFHDITDDSSALYELFSTTETLYYNLLYQVKTITSDDYHKYDTVVEPLAVAIFELEQVLDQLGWWNY